MLQPSPRPSVRARFSRSLSPRCFQRDLVNDRSGPARARPLARTSRRPPNQGLAFRGEEDRRSSGETSKRSSLGTGYGPSGAAPSAKWRAPPWSRAPHVLTRTGFLEAPVELLRRHGRHAQGVTTSSGLLKANLSEAADRCPILRAVRAGHHNSAMLRRFLDAFGFDYEFSASDYYAFSRRARRDADDHARPLRSGGDHAADAARGTA